MQGDEDLVIEEIERKLPNGFHDATVKRIEIDLLNRTLKIDIDIDISDVGDAEIKSRSATLNVMDLVFCAIEPPRELGYFNLETRGAWVAYSSSEKPKNFQTDIPSPLPAGAFEHYFFISEWNSFIVIVAKGAKLE